MWLPILALFVAFQGLIASDLRSCEINKCLESVPENVIDNPVFLPSEDELIELCPKTTESIDCIVTVVEDCAGKTIAELAVSDDIELSRAGNIIINIRQLYADMCDEQSSFHKDLMQTGSCIKQYGATMDRDECPQEALEAYSVYKQYLEANPEELDLRGEQSEMCIVESFTLACQVINMKEQCGDASVNVIKRLMKEIKVLGYDICSPEDTQALKNKFLDTLDLEEEHRNAFSAVLDIKKKK